jgi:hypothetical protein
VAGRKRGSFADTRSGVAQGVGTTTFMGSTFKSSEKRMSAVEPTSTGKTRTRRTAHRTLPRIKVLLVNDLAADESDVSRRESGK